jgi:hypothetical protein
MLCPCGFVRFRKLISSPKNYLNSIHFEFQEDLNRNSVPVSVCVMSLEIVANVSGTCEAGPFSCTVKRLIIFADLHGMQRDQVTGPQRHAGTSLLPGCHYYSEKYIIIKVSG